MHVHRFGGLSLSFWSGKYFAIMAGHSGSETPLPASFTPASVAVAGVVLGECRMVTVGEWVSG